VDTGRANWVVGTGGTFTTLAALVLGLSHYDREQTHLARLSRAQLETQIARLVGADVAARRRMLAEPGRAEVILGGAVILGTLLSELDIAELLVSERDILDGIAMSLRTPG
jgi:exopolyphosphatase/guanosine-5'-triphosphate,3'-diphosphate pyrophosphatase